MNTAQASDLLSQALLTTAMVAGPILVISLIVGLFVSVIQAATQINEATLTFLPKLIVVAVIMWVGGPWMLGQLITFTRTVILALPGAAR
jgi:flagellar biosynthetic protein FliQ